MTARLATGRARWTAGVVALVLALVAGVALVATPSDASEVVTSLPAPRPVAHVTAEWAKPAKAPPSAQQARAASVPHQPVAPAAPTAFRIWGPKFDIRATVCGMDNIRPLDPPGDQYTTVCWVQEGFGVAPGTSSGGTSYILGHSWAQAPLVLTPLSTTAMASMDMGKPVDLGGVPVYPTKVLDGYQVGLATPNGQLTYTVDSAYAVAKMQAADVAPLMDEKTPDRVVIITCGVNDGQDVDVNIIVNATLTSSTAA